MENAIDLTFTGSFDSSDLRVLLPDNMKAEKMVFNGQEVDFVSETIENSNYVVKKVSEPGVHQMRILLK